LHAVALSQAHVRPDEESALALVGIPAQPESDTVMIVLDDLTEQERRELAEREFVSNAAHELRTLLTTIIGAIEVLQAGAKDDVHERDRFLAHIEREAERLARLARALLTLARAHAGQERPRLDLVPLYPLLQELADGTRAGDGVSEAVVLATLQRRAGRTTTLVISHRASTLAACDQGIVVDGGRIVEVGPLTQLDWYKRAHAPETTGLVAEI